MPVVSIICPMYNHGPYIAQCISSILQQTFQDWELIIIDDGSTDDSANVVSKFTDTRIHYYHRIHCGISGLHNLYCDALQRAQGEYVAICEGDDYWPNNRLTNLLDALIDPKVVLSYGITQLVDNNGGVINQTIPSASHLQQNNPIILCNKNPIGSAVRAMLNGNALWSGAVSSLIRRSSLDKIGGFQSMLGDCMVDRPTFYTLGLVGEFRFIPEVTGYWRQHHTSITKSIKSWTPCAIGLHEFIKDFVKHYQSKLMLTNTEAVRIINYWGKVDSSARLGRGRLYLLERDYGNARKDFTYCIMSRYIRYALPALFGYIASYLKTDVECIYRMLRQKTLSLNLK